MHSAGIRLTWLASVGLLSISAPALAEGPAAGSATRVRVAMRQPTDAPPPPPPAAPAPAVAPAPATPAPAPVGDAPAVAPAPVAPPPVAPAPLAPASLAPAPDAQTMVVVYLESPRPVNLEQRPSPEAPWQYACPAPCGVRLPKSAEVRVTGQNLNSSRPLSLSGFSGAEVTLNVSPGLPWKHHTGIAVTVLGGVVTVAGGIVLLTQAGFVKQQNADASTHNGKNDLLTVGMALVGGGLAVVIGGGALTYDNAHSRLAEAGPATPAKDALALPTHTALALPSAVGVSLPILGGAF